MLNKGKLEKKMVEMVKEKLRGVLRLVNLLLGSGELVVYVSRRGQDYIQLSETKLVSSGEKEDELLSHLNYGMRFSLQHPEDRIILGLLREGPLDSKVELEQVYRDVINVLNSLMAEAEKEVMGQDNLNLMAMEALLSCHSAESFKLEENFQHILRIIEEVTGAERCLITLTKEGSNIFSQNLSGETAIEGLGQIPDSISHLVLETKKPLVVFNALTDPRCDPLWAQGINVVSFVTLPIFSFQGHPVATLTLGYESYSIFSKEQLRFTELICRQIGLMFSNYQYIGDLRTMARIDGLTGLYNRHTFEKLYEEIYDQHKRERRNFSLMMLDIDNFKEVNDQYGHLIGDEILKRVAEKITRNVRKQDVVARYGGEEVIVLLVDIQGEEAKLIAERIRDSIASFRINGVGVTVSIGICSFFNCHVEKNRLIELADQCLYEAKRFGKNHVRCWEPECLH